MVTCGSEATIVRNVTVRNCRLGANVPMLRLKLRPDTPQLYEKHAVSRTYPFGKCAGFV